MERGKLPTEQVGDLQREYIEDPRLVVGALDGGEFSLATALANRRYRLEPRHASGLSLS